MKWRTTTLEACCTIVAGATPSTSNPKFWGGEIEWATPKDLSDLDGKKFISRTARRITTKGLESCAATILPAGSVLFSSRAPIGHVAINTVPMATNQGFKSFVPKPDEVDAGFLYYWLRANRTLFESLGNGATFKEVSRAVVARITIELPPIPEQRRIADMLDMADSIRRKRKEAIALTEELLRSTFLEMFGDPVTNPKGWLTRPVSELGEVTTGNTPSRSVPENFGDHLEWIKSDNINTPSHFLTRATEGLSPKGKKTARVAPPNSILMTCIAGSPACIGNVALADRAVAFNQQINAITPFPGVDYRFLYTSFLVGKRLIQSASTNSMKGMVSKGKLEEVRLPTPPEPEQTRFGEIFDKIIRINNGQMTALDHTETLSRALLATTFSGL